MSVTKLATRIVGVALAGSLALLGGALAQQQPSSTQMIDALKVKPVMRSINGPKVDPAKAAEERKVIDTLRSLKRAIVVEERKQLEEIVKDKPTINLEVTFDYNSAVINVKALPLLQELGKALSSPDLKGSVFMLGGHTDASGGDAYNQGLSERRAEAVRRFLVEKFKLPVDGFVVTGFGKTRLKNPAEPLAEVNRRVQVVNLASK
jgi:outer membrane protein OmpA-like peptidoglycan-associated protein